MPTEIRMDYGEYEKLLNQIKELEKQNKKLNKLTKKQRHKLKINIYEHDLFRDSVIHVSYVLAGEEIMKACDVVRKEIAGKYIKLNKIKNKWWFKLFGRKFNSK